MNHHAERNHLSVYLEAKYYVLQDGGVETV